MTKAAAIYNFWLSFGLQAFDENAVPTGDDAPEYPYITYELITDSLGNPVAMTGSLWYRGSSWTAPNAKAEEIGAYIGRGGIVLSCDGGGIWINRGTPFAQSMRDDNDDLIRRKIINIQAEYLTAD